MTALISAVFGLLSSFGLVVPGTAGAIGIATTIAGILKSTKWLIAVGATFIILCMLLLHLAIVGSKNYEISKLKDTVNAQTLLISSYKIDMSTLKESNASLEDSLKDAKAEQEAIIVYYKSVMQKEDSLNLELFKLKESQDSNKTASDTGGSRFIGDFNANAKCEIENFYNFEGACINGVWRQQ